MIRWGGRGRTRCGAEPIHSGRGYANTTVCQLFQNKPQNNCYKSRQFILFGFNPRHPDIRLSLRDAYSHKFNLSFFQPGFLFNFVIPTIFICSHALLFFEKYCCYLCSINPFCFCEKKFAHIPFSSHQLSSLSSIFQYLESITCTLATKFSRRQ